MLVQVVIFFIITKANKNIDQKFNNKWHITNLTILSINIEICIKNFAKKNNGPTLNQNRHNLSPSFEFRLK